MQADKTLGSKTQEACAAGAGGAQSVVCIPDDASVLSWGEIPPLFNWCHCLFSLSQEVLPKIHEDKQYPCTLVGTWNTWYGEQDQAGRKQSLG